jgi:hypothetical protein
LDGVNWTQRVSGVSDELCGVCFSQGRFVAVGTRRTILVSQDGHLWARAMPHTSVGLRAVAAGPDGFVAVGCGEVLTSPDARNWHLSSVGRQQDTIQDVAWGGGVWVAVGKGGRILASTNGRNWVEPERITTAPLIRVRFANGQFIAAGKNGVLLRSKDGLEWEQVRTPQDLVEAVIAWCER